MSYENRGDLATLDAAVDAARYAVEHTATGNLDRVPFEKSVMGVDVRLCPPWDR